jgi:peptidyl-prolyl cis-trans isomerase SurA
METSKNSFLKRIYQQAGFRRRDFPEAELLAYTDSALLNKSLSAFRVIESGTTLFSFAKQQYNVKEWLDYVKSVPNLRARSGNKTDGALFEKYIQTAALDYYRNHLEDYNKDFAFQLNEFKEGNLLFEIMQRKIWNKASTDSSSLKKYYESHKDRYWWETSADAILFTCSNEKAAEDLKKGLQLNPSDWRKTVDAAGAMVQADSGRYELAQLQASGKTGITAGQFTPFTRNSGTDNAVSFSYILRAYQDRAPRNYLDARGFVINDYQNFLEDQWMVELRKKYPVKLDETVFGSLPK